MFNPNKVKVGISPIGWTNDDLPELGGDIPFLTCIDDMEAEGYQGCEIGNKFPKDPKKLKPLLDKRGLVACNEWFPTYFTSRPYEDTIELFQKQSDKMQALGGNIIGASEQGNSIQVQSLPVFGENKPILTDEQWKTLAKGYNQMGEMARERGQYFCVHHHMGTGIQTEDEIERLMDLTDPELVFLVFCIGHMVCAGNDAEKMLKKYVKRVRHVHMKDVRQAVRKRAIKEKMSFLDAVYAGIFTIPGNGDVAFEPLLKILDENGYEGFLMVEAEQDPAKAPPREYAKRARAYIREHTGL